MHVEASYEVVRHTDNPEKADISVLITLNGVPKEKVVTHTGPLEEVDRFIGERLDIATSYEVIPRPEDPELGALEVTLSFKGGAEKRRVNVLTGRVSDLEDFAADRIDQTEFARRSE